MALERENSNIGIEQYLEYGFKPLLVNIELCYKIGLLYELIQKLNNKNYVDCFDTVCILFNYARDGIELYDNDENNKNSYLTFFNLLNDLKYNIRNINSKKYLNELNKILEYYLKQLASNLNNNLILKPKGKTLSINIDSLYYQIFNNFKIIVFNFMNNIVNNKISNSKTTIQVMSKVLLNIHSSLVHAYIILLPEKYDYEALKELEIEYKDYLISLKEVLECLKEGQEITDELANQCVYNYEAINSSMHIDSNISVLCFGGRNDEYRKIRECLLYQR